MERSNGANEREIERVEFRAGGGSSPSLRKRPQEIHVTPRTVPLAGSEEEEKSRHVCLEGARFVGIWGVSRIRRLELHKVGVIYAIDAQQKVAKSRRSENVTEA